MDEKQLRRIVRGEIAQMLAKYVAVGHIRPNIRKPKGEYFVVGELMTLRELKGRNSKESSKSTIATR